MQPNSGFDEFRGIIQDSIINNNETGFFVIERVHSKIREVFYANAEQYKQALEFRKEGCLVEIMAIPLVGHLYEVYSMQKLASED